MSRFWAAFFNTMSQLSLHPSDFWVYVFILTSEPQSWLCLFVFEAWIIFGSIWSLAVSWHSVSHSSSLHCWPRGWHWWIRGKKDAQSWSVRCHVTIQYNAQRCWQAGLNQKQMAKHAVASLPVPANFPSVSNVSADYFHKFWQDLHGNVVLFLNFYSSCELCYMFTLGQDLILTLGK